MKKLKFFSILFFLLTILSFPISFCLCGEIGEVEVFSTAGIVRYSWIMWLFIPFGIVSFIIGIKLKHNNQKYIKNFIAAFIFVPILLILGSFRFISNSTSYDDSILCDIERTTNIELPDKTKIASQDIGYTISHVKLTDETERAAFEEQLNKSNLWQTDLSLKIKYILPASLQMEMSVFDYFLLYNISEYQYNEYSQDEECECIFMAYDCDRQKLLILSNYIINSD